MTTQPYGTMTPHQAVKLLDVLYDMIETEWNEEERRSDYLEAIDHAQDALRDVQEHSEQHA